MKSQSTKSLWPVWVLANLLILGVIFYAWQIESAEPDRYYQLVQEDETMEWATFWAFFLAAVFFGKRALDQRREGVRLPWYYLGLAVFCFLVGMEEISWGQRLLGYRPPAYFLANNFQQELNVHNVMSTDLRKLVLKAVIFGYGVLLPLLAWIPEVRARLRRLGIYAPPLFLAPSFLATYWLYEEYPWTHTGEWVEYTLGLGFLFAALLAPKVLPTKSQDKALAQPPSQPLWRQLASPALVWLVVLALGAITAAWSRQASAAEPEMLKMAQLELAALQQDILDGQLKTRRKSHKRLYSFIEKYEQNGFLSGDFSRLTEQGLPAERARYFLDPWNSPYWIRMRCNDNKSLCQAFIYSFGPNRRRESSRTEILGDDLGTEIIAVRK